MAAKANVALLMTFVVVTIPTFWLNDAVGRKLKKAPIIFVTPRPTIAPCNSSVVGWRSIAPDVVAEKSPIAWTELIVKRMEMAMIAGISNSSPK